jgi:hypothetical protein
MTIQSFDLSIFSIEWNYAVNRHFSKWCRYTCRSAAEAEIQVNV